MSIDNESIFKAFNRLLEEQPGLPYSFQNENKSGAEDVSFILFKDNLSQTVKDEMAMELMDIITVGMIELSSFSYNLHKYLTKKPIYMYMSNISTRIKLILSEEIIDKDKLYSLGIRFATDSEDLEEVQLGILILGFFENDLTKHIINTLGLHSDITIFAIEASKEFSNHNEFVYELAQHTCGYGKLAAITTLIPILPTHQKWMFDMGAINEVLPNISSIVCLEKLDMIAYYQRLKITKDKFSKLSYLLAYAGENTNLKSFRNSLILIEKYIKLVNTYAVTFTDLAAITIIEKCMLPYWNHSNKDVEMENGWTSNKENDIKNLCIEVLKQPRWKSTLYKELSQPFHKSSLVMKVISKMDLKLDFNSLLPLLSKDLFDTNIMEYVLIDNKENYLEVVMKYINSLIPEEVMSVDPQDICDEDLTSEYKPDFWVMYLIKGLREKYQYKEEFFIRYLTARLPDVRIEAISALRVFKARWSELVIPALEHACEIEPSKKIKKRFQRLLGKQSDSKQKEQRYIEVEEIKVAPSPWDVCLFTTTIAGTYFHDLCVIEGRIETGDILYLVREPENKFDNKAILVTTEDGYVLGYIPRIQNSLPTDLMDAGEKLYAILDSEYIGKPEIQIMLSKVPMGESNVIEFPLGIFRSKK